MEDIIQKIFKFFVSAILILFGHAQGWRELVSFLSFLFYIIVFVAIAIFCIFIIRKNLFGRRITKIARIILNVQAVIAAYFIVGIPLALIYSTTVPFLWPFLPLFVIVSGILLFCIRRIGQNAKDTPSQTV